MALTLLSIGAVLPSGGCGPLLFVPSAFTLQKVELIYSVQEDITLVRWRISSSDPGDPDLSFERLDEYGHYAPVDFSQSAYPGGGAPCADGTGSCFQYVVRGAYAPPSGIPPIRARHQPEGVLPGDLPAFEQEQTTLDVVSFFGDGNAVVYVNVTDTVAYEGAYAFPRVYQQAMWPTKGLCVSGSSPDGVGFSPVDPTTGSFPPPAPLTDDGIYCVGLRAVPADAGQAAVAQTRVATLPELQPVHLSYTPRIERSPIIYQVILDQHIVPERCDDSNNTILQQVDTALANAGADVKRLDPIYLASDPNAPGGPSLCAQPQSRALQDPDVMAEQIKQIVSGFPQIHQQFHLFYFNNLNAPLPPTLTDSFQILFDDLSTSPPGQDLKLLSWMFNPGLAGATGPRWWMSQSWQSAIGDPTLAETLASYVQANLPYTSQIHDPTVPVPFFTQDQVASFAGGMFKVCNQSMPFQFVDTIDVAPLFGGPAYPIAADDPPGLLVSLRTPTAEPASTFVPVSVEADLEVCTRYCTDHPYVSANGSGVTSWSVSSMCAESSP